MRRPTQLHAASAMAAAITTCAVLAACTTSSDIPPPTASPTPSSTAITSPSPSASTTSPAPSADEAAVLAAYQGFWAAKVATYAHPGRGDAPQLTRYAIDEALADTRATALIYQRNGIVRRGTPGLAPQITATPVGEPRTAVITDCLDSTHWQPVYKRTGKPAAAPGQPKRVVVVSTVQEFRGQWVVRTSVAHRDKSC